MGDNIEDEGIRNALAQLRLSEDIEIETTYMTLLACFILEEAFADFKD